MSEAQRRVLAETRVRKACQCPDVGGQSRLCAMMGSWDDTGKGGRQRPVTWVLGCQAEDAEL